MKFINSSNKNITPIIILDEVQFLKNSSLHIIIGKTSFGKFVCIPNYNVGCYLSRFNDLFWNSEKLSELMGEVDGVTAATAIKFIEHKLLLWDCF
ncbi:DUF6618 family protein [Clostridium sp.]|uniref:DUF6618 family protein n=1 Tax=Clostridium sp. TaxID=1506 RepID=UPI003216B064